MLWILKCNKVLIFIGIIFQMFKKIIGKHKGRGRAVHNSVEDPPLPKFATDPGQPRSSGFITGISKKKSEQSKADARLKYILDPESSAAHSNREVGPVVRGDSRIPSKYVPFRNESHLKQDGSRPSFANLFGRSVGSSDPSTIRKSKEKWKLFKKKSSTSSGAPSKIAVSTPSEEYSQASRDDDQDDSDSDHQSLWSILIENVSMLSVDTIEGNLTICSSGRFVPYKIR